MISFEYKTLFTVTLKAYGSSSIETTTVAAATMEDALAKIRFVFSKPHIISIKVGVNPEAIGVYL